MHYSFLDVRDDLPFVAEAPNVDLHARQFFLCCEMHAHL